MKNTQKGDGFHRLEVTSRVFAFVMAFTLIAPLLSAVRPAEAQILRRNPAQAKQGMTTKKKVLLVGGAALLYYLWRRHQAKQTATGTTTTTAARQPQLYRSKNGGVYYRDANGKPVWLTVPNRSVEVPAADIERYAPDWQRYRGPAPAAPSGYRTQNFGEYDSTLMRGSGTLSGPSRN